MAGILLNVLPKRTYDFGGLALSSGVQLPISDQIDIGDFIDGILIVRVHERNIGATGQLSFVLTGDGSADGAVGVFFQPWPNFAVVSIASSTPAPSLISRYGRVLGERAGVVLNALQGGSAGALSATVSIDVCLRSPDDSAQIAGARGSRHRGRRRAGKKKCATCDD